MQRKVYEPKDDPIWAKPYIDKEEEMAEKGCLYVHGGF